MKIINSILITFFYYLFFFSFSHGNTFINWKTKIITVNKTEYSSTEKMETKDSPIIRVPITNKTIDKHNILLYSGFQFYDELDTLVSSYTKMGLGIPISIGYLHNNDFLKNHIRINFSGGFYYTPYKNSQRSQFIRKPGSYFSFSIDYFLLFNITKLTEWLGVGWKNNKILIGGWLDNSFSLTIPAFLSFSYSLFQTIGFSFQWDMKFSNNNFLWGFNLSGIGAGFRPTYSGYDVNFEREIEKSNLFGLIINGYANHSTAISWHNYIRLNPFVNLRLQIVELIDLAVNYEFNFNYISFPHSSVSLKHTLYAGIIFKWKKEGVFVW